MFNKLRYAFLFLILISAKNSFAFNYAHDTYVMGCETNECFALSQDIKNIAKNTNFYLNLSPFFDIKLIDNFAAVQKEFAKDPTHTEVTIETQDKQKLTCSFFDRKKNKIIIIGPGFTNAKEKMAPFAHMFTDYDILLINFRGHGLKKSKSLSPTYNAIGVDGNCRVGICEENDVFAAINFAKQRKNYDKVIGLGICYGAFIIAKAQGIAEQKGLPAFDKIILDGCWTSLNEFISVIKSDPVLINNPQRGGASAETKYIIGSKIVSTAIVKGVEAYLGVDVNNGNLRDYIKQIKRAAVLFIYGKDDLTVKRKQFEELWNLTISSKLAIITNNPHVHNHLRSKELYKLACELFIEHDNLQTVTQLLSSPEQLMQELANNFAEKLKATPQNFVPIKIDKPKQGYFDYLMSYKLPAMFFGALYIGFKKGKIKLETIYKLAKIYGVYKAAGFLWRPAVRIISKL